MRSADQISCREAKIDLKFIARQLDRVFSEITTFRSDMAGFKGDMMVVIARLDRIDAAVQSLVVEVRAMHSRHTEGPQL